MNLVLAIVKKLVDMMDGSYGLKVERVEDGIQCVSKMEQMAAGSYDLILMDIQMPRLNGYEATRQIRALDDQNKSKILILAMTANAFEEDRQAAFEAGMDGYVVKPVEVKALLETMAGALEQ